MPCRSHPRTGPHPAPCPRAAQLFRASDAAYAPLAAARVVAILAERCADRDGPTRKFAAFAVGNAAFHSSALYAELAAAIPALVHRLRDDDARARANAAGALGNLARNADSLVGELTRHGAPAAAPGARAQRLDEAAGEAAGSAPADEERLAPARIALFALGNLATHRAAPWRSRSSASTSSSALPSQWATPPISSTRGGWWPSSTAARGAVDPISRSSTGP